MNSAMFTAIDTTKTSHTDLGHSFLRKFGKATTVREYLRRYDTSESAYSRLVHCRFAVTGTVKQATTKNQNLR